MVTNHHQPLFIFLGSATIGKRDPRSSVSRHFHVCVVLQRSDQELVFQSVFDRVSFFFGQRCNGDGGRWSRKISEADFSISHQPLFGFERPEERGSDAPRLGSLSRGWKRRHLTFGMAKGKSSRPRGQDGGDSDASLH